MIISVDTLCGFAPLSSAHRCVGFHTSSIPKLDCTIELALDSSSNTPSHALLQLFVAESRQNTRSSYQLQPMGEINISPGLAAQVSKV